MKTLRRFWWLAGIGALVVAIGVLLALPAWAAPSLQSTAPPSDTLAAVHAACTAADLEGMQGAMDSLTDEEWQVMQGHMAGQGEMMGGMMNGNQHGSMGSHMAGQGGMMGGQSGRAMMGQ